MAIDQEALYDTRFELIDFLIDALADVPPRPLVAGLFDESVRVPSEGISAELDAGFEALETFVAENDDRDPESVRDELSAEYTRLFVGPRPPVIAQESYYREDTDYLGDGLATVKGSYGAVGWSPVDEYPEEADHVAVELAFLRELISRQRGGEADAFGYQRVFHEEHLDRWIDDCAADIVDCADSAFYEAVGYLLTGYVTFEAEIAMQMG